MLKKFINEHLRIKFAFWVVGLISLKMPKKKKKKNVTFFHSDSGQTWRVKEKSTVAEDNEENEDSDPGVSDTDHPPSSCGRSSFFGGSDPNDTTDE